MTFAVPLPAPWKMPPAAEKETSEGITIPSRLGPQGLIAAVPGRTKAPSGRLPDTMRAVIPTAASFPAVILAVIRARQKIHCDRAFNSSARMGKRTGKSRSSSVSHRRKVMPPACSCTAPSAVEQARTLDMAALCPAITACSAIADRCWRRNTSTRSGSSHRCPIKSSVRNDRAFSSFASRTLHVTHRNVRQRVGMFCCPYASTANWILPNRERISRWRSARA